MSTPQVRVAVVVTGKRESALRRFLAYNVKRAFGLEKNMWRLSYRECYPLVVISRPLRAGEDPQAVYGRHAGAGALVLTALYDEAPGSGRAATLAWLEQNGFSPMAELEFQEHAGEAALIDQGAEVVNFVNLHCPWRRDEIDDLDAYMEKNNKPFWA